MPVKHRLSITMAHRVTKFAAYAFDQLETSLLSELCSRSGCCAPRSSWKRLRSFRLAERRLDVRLSRTFA